MIKHGTELAFIENINLDRLKKALTEKYGKRCKDYETMCYVCRIWRAYDEIKFLVGELRDDK